MRNSTCVVTKYLGGRWVERTSCILQTVSRTRACFLVNNSRIEYFEARNYVCSGTLIATTALHCSPPTMVLLLLLLLLLPLLLLCPLSGPLSPSAREPADRTVNFPRLENQFETRFA